MSGYCSKCGETGSHDCPANKPAGRVEDYKFDTSNYVILPTNASEVRAEIVALLDSPEMVEAVKKVISKHITDGRTTADTTKAALTAIIERLK